MTTLSLTQKVIQPVNNIYRVPIERIFHLPCSEGRPIQGAGNGYTLIEADSETDAVRRLEECPNFAVNYFRLTAEQRETLRREPFMIREGEITRVLHCDERFKNKYGDFTCGMPIHDIEGHENQHNEFINANGKFQMCCLEGYDVPSGCPYENRRDLLSRC